MNGDKMPVVAWGRIGHMKQQQSLAWRGTTDESGLALLRGQLLGWITPE